MSTVLTVVGNAPVPLIDADKVQLSKDGVDAVTGTFSGKTQGSTFVVNGYSLTISYTANSTNGSFSGGNDIALMVPEPTGVALMFGGLATLLCGRRRRP